MGSFKPAVMDGVGLFIALGGTSRSGKTKSALRLAKGIAGDKKIAAIDTEGKRLSHYSGEFDFDVINMRSPFSGQRFSELTCEAEEAGYGALVTDSFSLEWSGVGGVLELYDELFAKTNFNQKLSDICWSRAKKEHKRMMNELVQSTIPIIFCMRANAVPAHLCKNGADKAPGGAWKVEQDKRFIYEWTIGLVLHPDTPGKPRYDMVDFENKSLWKVNPEHRHLFPEGQFISEAAGEELRKWRFGELARKAGSAAVGAIAGAALTDNVDEAAGERQSFRKDWDAGTDGSTESKPDTDRDFAENLIRQFQLAKSTAEMIALTKISENAAWSRRTKIERPELYDMVGIAFEQRESDFASRAA